MGIEIQDGRGGFYQWDTCRKLTVITKHYTVADLPQTELVIDEM